MLMKLLSTNRGLGMFWVRLPLGLSMVIHGWGKVSNVPGFLQYCDNLGIPPALAYCAMAGEFFGGLGVIFGCLSRIAAFGTASVMIVAAVMRHMIPGYGYLMDWHAGTPWGAEGYEFHTLAIGMSLGIIFAGAGVLSIDYWWAQYLAKRTERPGLGEPAQVRVHGD
jgi:putative oxidoreductase